MPDVVLIVAVGTALFVLLALFIAFMVFYYQKRRLEYQDEVKGLAETYQKEILKAQLEMQEQTFHSIAQEIHDNVGQILSLARLNMNSLENALQDHHRQKITTSKELVDQALSDLRDLSKRLNSKYASQQPLATLLKTQLDLIKKTGAVETSFDVIGQEAGLLPEKKLILFRIAQEALNNSLKHADASCISAQLEFTPRQMTLRVLDDGRGLAKNTEGSPEPPLNGTGLQNMNFRAGLIGASFSITGQTGSGTLVQIDLPLE
ncbi:sensor histidine kinase [Rufibacter ruber]|uniref:sensor histidine kinase n=1 Tax=Rufibacter ruber TaxID=1783499 RepID=UPI0009EEB83E|nr:histidine kinase [Rufibacter ruber]